MRAKYHPQLPTDLTSNGSEQYFVIKLKINHELEQPTSNMKLWSLFLRVSIQGDEMNPS